MKQKKTMILLAVVLITLVAVYIGLKCWNQHMEEKKEKQAEEQKLSIVDAEELSSISYTDGESEMSFVKQDGTWYDESDRGIRISQDAADMLETAITDLTASRELEEPDALGDYGLENALYTIEYTDQDDTESVISVGNAVNDDYYATIGDTGKVYTISSDFISQLSFDLASFVENDTVPSIGSGNLKKVEVTENGKTTTFKEENEIGQLAGGWGTISLTSCTDYNVKEENLVNYGLDEEKRITAKATYKDSSTEEEKTFTVYIGSQDDSGSNRYVQVKDSNMVYIVGNSIIDNMITVGEEESAK
ncbi:MAG: DUF4340 domain-containing protein [Dorea sp.]